MKKTVYPLAWSVLLLFGSLVAALGSETNSISYGQILPGSITNVAQTNFYTFNANSNDLIYLTLLRTNGTGVPYFYLYDPDGTVVSGATISGNYVAVSGAKRLTKTGAYTIQVIEDSLANTYDYLLSFTKVAPGVNEREAGDGAEGIVPGQITSGHISPADMDTFTFSGTSNDVVYLTLLRTNGTGVPYFYLYDPDGTVVSGANISGNYVAVSGSKRLTKTGTYTVLVIENGWEYDYDYLLSFTKVAPGVNEREASDGAEGIVPGQITSGHISPADMDTFTFSGTSNDVVYLTLLRTNGTGVPYFYLYDPDGTVVSGANISGNYMAVSGSKRLTKTGTYTVLVIENGWEYDYDYLLSFTKVAPGVNEREAGDGAEGIVPGQIISGHISPADMDTFTFSGISNDVVDLTLVRTNGTGVPYFYLYDPDGTVVSGASISGNYVALLSGRRLTKTGTYTVLVIENSWEYSYDYTFCTINVPGPNFPDPGDGAYTMSAGDTRSGQITPGDLDAYAFHGIAGDTLTVTVQKTSGTGLNPVVQLFAPDGTLLATGSSANSAQVQVSCVAETGTYTIVIYDNGYNEAFGYDVTLGQSPNVPPSSGLIQYLAAYECGGDVWLRWETNSAGFILESTFDLSTTNWFPVGEIPQVIADHNYVDVGVVTNLAQFYRLRYTNSYSP